MFAEAGAWFWTMVVASIAIVIGDYNGTLEPALNKFEERIGIRTTLPDDTTEDVPYYIPPITEEVDSTWILPDSLKRNNDE
jgi:hypothetical protein|tara:strand:+ start:925 stop:1167 length:243 start_codon:yes stop_codon:yes gene_type:complete